ncbi:MAG: endopeptidase La [Tepidisphaeraceae bacterium]
MSDPLIISRTDTHTVIRSGQNNQNVSVPNVIPVLPIRNLVVFPGTVMPLNIGRPKSKAVIDEVMPGDKLVAVVSQRNPDTEDPGEADLYTVGVVCTILKLLKLNDGNQSIIVHGLARFRIKNIARTEPFLTGEIEILDDISGTGNESEALVASVKTQAARVVELSPNTPDEVQQVITSITNPSALADFLAANLNADVPDKLKLLEELDVDKRLKVVAQRLAQQLDMLELQSKIQTQVKESIDKNQRRYYLQEQIKAIRKELGEADVDGNTEAENLREKIRAAGLPEIVLKEAERELSRMESIPQASPEYGVIRTYLQLVSELPWSKETPDKINLVEAREVLDRDHHGLDKVKQRIIQYLAVRKLKGTVESPVAKPNVTGERHAGAILCFVGPPGVGKTSLGKSIAESMGRQFIRVALGGVRDEAEIRGHRRTYIGSMPGRIISEIRKAGTRNPVMMLDEIDKLGADFRGDPASALLEVLDPAQNHSFTDHYLDVPFDLSKVLFIATANTMDTVPAALRDRMEVIEIPGYTQSDKLSISKQYLVPRQLEANGLKKQNASFPDGSLRYLIEAYTREAGVRNLERMIGSICRAIAAEVVMAADAKEKEAKATKTEQRVEASVGAPTDAAKAHGTAMGLTSSAETEAPSKSNGSATSTLKIKVDDAYIEKVLGPRRFESELAQRTSIPGIATGLAYTPVGGEILFIEATRMPGKGGVILTGQIGEVMKESATAAFSLIKSRAEQMKIDPKLLAESDVHIHVPAGAVPKDGPSAGVAMFTALASLFLNKPVRPSVAMTGEITLRGLVLPIGGLKEKTLAAKSAGITDVIIPRRNAKDMPELPDEVRTKLKFHQVDTVDEALAIAIGKPSTEAAAKKK